MSDTPLLPASAAPAAAADKQDSCSEVHFVFAAGTGESGFGLVGGPLANKLALEIPGITSHAISYDTTPSDYGETVKAGARTIAQYLADQSTRCPDQRFILGGYSKGAMVIHTTNLDPPSLKSKVSTVLVFGDPRRKNREDTAWPINSPSVSSDPRNGSSSKDNVASFCNCNDYFCDPASKLPDPDDNAHTRYATDGSVDVAATFAKERV
ncbi:cutinase [Rhizoctonia solani 123E]|uniref:Cutinase n=1 Tax=Rhizoctonia solani 123E TaxID=1423351 RepID=A0A074RZY3_9AGAM|nr:cutinase [Rhizoctonia solani 123E]